jgi:hypothetical protein
VVELRRLQPGFGETPSGGKGREAGDVLDSVEALFLRCCDEYAVDDERRCGVAVVRV